MTTVSTPTAVELALSSLVRFDGKQARRPRLLLDGLWLPVVLIAGVALPAEATVPHQVLRTKSGVLVVAVQAPSTTWAVVQLHVRARGDSLRSSESAGLEAFTHTLARGQGRRGSAVADDIAAAGGETRSRLNLDSLVISDGVPIAQLDVALRALDKRLAERRQLLPGPPSLGLLTDRPSFPPSVRQLFAPGHPYALPSHGASDAETLRALADRLLRRENVVVVVYSPLSSRLLLPRVNRALRTTLPRGALVVPPLIPVEGTRVMEQPRGVGSSDLGGIWLMLPTTERGHLHDEVGLDVLARLLDGRSGSSEGFGWLELPVREHDAGGEAGRLAELESLATPKNSASTSSGPDRSGLEASDDLLHNTLASVVTSRHRDRRSPEGAAFALGQRALGDFLSGRAPRNARTLDDGETQVQAFKHDDLRALANLLLRSPRVIVREGPVSDAPGADGGASESARSAATDLGAEQAGADR